ncbi:hypothetical protein ACFWOB_03250 [Streptomyces sp. NPDC058420]|uniref:hypothetical protein n=1 Tax=Streptomyces sp. NPDC058420 TaxID=3346489 RepID=UPI003656A3A5
MAHAVAEIQRATGKALDLRNPDHAPLAPGARHAVLPDADPVADLSHLIDQRHVRTVVSSGHIVHR